MTDTPAPAVPPRRRRGLRILGALVVALVAVIGVGCAGMVRCYRSGLHVDQAEREVRDVTQLVRIHPDQVAHPHTTGEVQALVRAHDGPISIGGGRFSQGGQVGVDGTLFLDMREMDDVLDLDVANRVVRVEAGATWRTLQDALDPHDLSLEIMQSYANFTVGGSLSVNGHGRYVNEGPLVRSVRSLDLVTASGERLHASRTERPDVFFGAIGGYGGLGVITEVELDLAPNEPVAREVERMPASAFPAWFDENVRGSDRAVFFNADLYAPDFDDLVSITFERTDEPVTVADRLQPRGGSTAKDRFAYWWVSEAPLGKQARRDVIDRMRLADREVVWRNYEASYDAYGLEPGSRDKSTYVLQEYFVPVERFEGFRAKMAEIFTRYGVNVLNVSIRHAAADPDTLLTWAPRECFAFVVYYKQQTDEAARTEVGVWTRELVDAVIAEEGTYYLPYQILATEEQFHRAYPGADRFFALKMTLDPEYRFRNRLWDTYLPPARALAAEARDRTLREALHARPDYLRPEDQTFLTLPEWYIVYSGDELGAHLSDGGTPSGFPFASSVCQFCRIYGAVTAATRDRYPANRGYHAMIWVIGASYAAEYAVKGAWEATVGRITEWMGAPAPQDTFYAGYATDYGAFMHHTPWYAFPFAERRKQLPGGGGVRGLERRLAYGGELTAKSWWGWAMGGASQSAYGAETEKIRAWVRAPDGVDLAAVPGVLEVEDLGGGASLVTVQRYEPFTAAIQALVAQGVDIVEIAGCERLVVQVVAPIDPAGAPWSGTMWGDVVVAWPILTRPGEQRVALEVPVRRLDEVLPALEAAGGRIEHLYDY
ncbi:MAG: FAD-binding oxidoreductase [Myxococcota bacterium]